jgi:hypothetical protein
MYYSSSRTGETGTYFLLADWRVSRLSDMAAFVREETCVVIGGRSISDAMHKRTSICVRTAMS